jgi:tRNA U34 5-methylaminomethyl-2-thiouridine-forming methyltransferase MnmC
MKGRQLLVTEDGSHTLIVPELKETYHSTHGAIRESDHVFIREGLQYYSIEKQITGIKIFEVGFGTGLNTLLTALFAEKQNLIVTYETIEAFPLEEGILMELNYLSQLDNGAANDIFTKMHASKWNELVQVSKYLKLRKIHTEIQVHQLSAAYDICYFDAFAPSKQPEMWELNVLEKIHDAMKSGGVFVTYCAQGQLKRNLRNIGFEVFTLEGPPGKKEMIRAIKI